MASNNDLQTTPPLPLVCAGMLIVSAMVLAGVARHTGVGATRVAAPEFVRSVDVRFEELPTGQLRLSDIAGHLPPRVFEPGKDDFVRVATRSLLRDRAAIGAAADAPIRLGIQADGRLWLRDLATDRLLLLDAYGYANRGSFAQFIEAKGGQP